MERGSGSVPLYPFYVGMIHHSLLLSHSISFSYSISYS